MQLQSTFGAFLVAFTIANAAPLLPDHEVNSDMRAWSGKLPEQDRFPNSADIMARDPKGGKGGGSGGSGKPPGKQQDGGNSFTQDVLSNTAGSVISDGIWYGVDQATAENPPAKRSPKGGKGPSKPPGKPVENNQNGGGSFTQDVLSNTAGSVISDGVWYGVDQAANAKRSPKGGRGGGRAGDFGKDVASDVAADTISTGLWYGVDQAANAKRSPKGGRGGGRGPSRLGDFGKDVVSDVVADGISTGIYTGVDQAVNAKRSPKGGRGGGGRGGGRLGDFGKDVASDVIADGISTGIYTGVDQAVNAKRSPKGGRGGGGRGGGRLGDFGKDVASDVIADGISTGIYTGVDQAVNAKRDPRFRFGGFGGLGRFGKDVASDVAAEGVSTGVSAGVDQATNEKRKFSTHEFPKDLNRGGICAGTIEVCGGGPKISTPDVMCAGLNCDKSEDVTGPGASSDDIFAGVPTGADQATNEKRFLDTQTQDHALQKDCGSDKPCNSPKPDPDWSERLSKTHDDLSCAGDEFSCGDKNIYYPAMDDTMAGAIARRGRSRKGSPKSSTPKDSTKDKSTTDKKAGDDKAAPKDEGNDRDTSDNDDSSNSRGGFRDGAKDMALNIVGDAASQAVNYGVQNALYSQPGEAPVPADGEEAIPMEGEEEAVPAEGEEAVVKRALRFFA
ncbi:hypothetical protein Daus18300_005429 [Diaporthe australafricana]|uniref:Uncharacterized protein n=1 Tax=Diaporthe australafricana TaxID=127596 RepID=A0ABR3X121_9PEZI